MIGEDAALLDSALLQATQQLDVGICVASADGRVLYVNPALHRMHGPGHPATDIQEMGNMHRLVDPRTGDVVPLHDYPLVAALRGETVLDREVYLEHPTLGKRLLSVSAAPILTESGQRGAYAFARDLSELAERERRLREAEWQHNTILDHVPFALWIKDREGRYMVANRTFCELAGRPREAVLGARDHDFMPKDFADICQESDEQVLRQQSPYVQEQQIGDLLYEGVVETMKQPLFDSRGQAVGTVGMARDITNERRAERSLLQTQQDLAKRVEERTRELERVQESLVRQERLAALGQLAGGVAHQLRNPLAALTSAGYVLRRYIGDDSSDAKLALDIIFEESKRANDIISGLLDYAKTRGAVRHPADLQSIVAQATHAAQRHGQVSIELQIPDGLQVMVDSDQVSSALTNLIDNAYDAMPGGGSLQIAATCSGSTVSISVRDTGSGVPDDRVEELFTPLYTTKPLGLGLGLVTARTLIEHQGGSLEYRKPPQGAGAVFEVQLPTR